MTSGRQRITSSYRLPRFSVTLNKGTERSNPAPVPPADDGVLVSLGLEVFIRVKVAWDGLTHGLRGRRNKHLPFDRENHSEQLRPSEELFRMGLDTRGYGIQIKGA